MQGRQYFIELGGALLAYGAALVVSLLTLRGGAMGPWRVIVSLLPMLPGCAMCWAIIRQLRRIDEFQRRLHLEALAFAFAATALLTFSYGFLENAGFPRMSMFVVWPVMAVSWVLGVALARVALRVKNLVRQLRSERNWSQSELGARLAVSRQTINAIEAERYDPSLPLAFKIARLFGLRVEEVFDDGAAGPG